MNDARLLFDGFLDSVARFPDRPALNVDGQEISYTELNHDAQRIAAIIDVTSSGRLVPIATTIIPTIAGDTSSRAASATPLSIVS